LECASRIVTDPFSPDVTSTFTGGVYDGVTVGVSPAPATLISAVVIWILWAAVFIAVRLGWSLELGLCLCLASVRLG